MVCQQRRRLLYDRNRRRPDAYAGRRTHDAHHDDQGINDGSENPATYVDAPRQRPSVDAPLPVRPVPQRYANEIPF
jgi:hypothetical protein